MGEALPQGIPYTTHTKRICVTAGSGQRATCYGAAQDFFLHPALASPRRLALMSYLAVHGPVRTRHLMRVFKMPAGLHTDLHGMAKMGLLRTQAFPNRNGCWDPEGNLMSLRWHATPDGRKWLWRFGCVTARLCPEITDEPDPYPGAFPPHVLRRHARRQLMRPLSLALAAELLHRWPKRLKDLTWLMGVPHGTVLYRLNQWKAIGWLEDRPGARNSRWQHWYIPQVWHVTPFGRDEMYRHCQALWHAALNSGYPDHLEDRYRHGEDKAHWEPRDEDYQRIYITVG
jgi:hypothetical protein